MLFLLPPADQRLVSINQRRDREKERGELLMFTPWGAPKRALRLETGITALMTARKGGLMLSRGYAERRLSVPAQRQAVRFGEYYAYDFDHAWAIPMLELNHLWKALGSFCKPELLNAPKTYLRELVATYHADYLTEMDAENASTGAR